MQDKRQGAITRLPVQSARNSFFSDFSMATATQNTSTVYFSSPNNTFSTVSKPEKIQQKIPVEKIHFSQKSVSEYFSDGRALADVVQALIEQKALPHDIPAIRVVFYHHRWVTLDNRRLRVFKDAGVAAITVEVCDLSVPEIKREFELKRTHKAIEEGAEIRRFSSSGSKKHFDEGTFIFTKKVLSWNLTQIQTPHQKLEMREALPFIFNRRLGLASYYESFLDLILEEARAVLHQALEAIENKNTSPIGIKLMRHKLAKNVANPSSLYFECEARSTGHKNLLKSNDVVLLCSGTLRFIAMAGYLKPDEHDQQIFLKAIIDEDMRVNHAETFKSWHETHQGWQLYPMESLVTHLRMYEACVTQKDFLFIEQVMYGNLSLSTEDSFQMPLSPLGDMNTSFRSLSLSERVEPPEMQKLNDSQRETVSDFLHLEQGIRLIQGPPGTGKTTTLITLLEMASKNARRILVCAPSNKAVQILAERFLEACPHTSAILVGVEDKLPDKPVLKAIFIHTWKAQIQAEVDQLFELGHVLKAPLVLPEKEKLASEENKDQGSVEDQVELPILSQKERQSLNESIQALNQRFTHLVNRLKNFNLIFLSKWMSEQVEFLPALQYYAENLNRDEKTIREFPLEWLEAQQKSLGVVFRIISHLNVVLQGQEDEAIESALLNAVKVVFATLSVTGRKAFRELQAVDSLIIDEAGQAVEAETLIALQTNPKKCLLVGDTKQLPATVISKLAEKLKFDRSLLWRLLEDCQQPHGFLQEQYRMHPEISVWPSKRYYHSQLTNAPVVSDPIHQLVNLKDAPDFLGPYAFIHVEGHETFGKEGRSLWNFAEQNAIVDLVRCLHQRYHIDIEKQVGIISFYKAQVEKISEKLHRFYPKLVVQTVDGFQGGENDIIIISFVRANSEGNVGFLSDFRRLNVAITRARFSLLMVGHSETLENNEKDVALLIQDAKERQKIFSYSDIASALKVKRAIQQPHSTTHKKPYKQKKHAQKTHKHPTEKSSSTYEKNRCYFFNGTAGSCRRGDTCTFSHEIPLTVKERPKMQNADQAPASNVSNSTSNADIHSTKKNHSEESYERKAPYFSNRALFKGNEPTPSLLLETKLHPEKTSVSTEGKRAFSRAKEESWRRKKGNEKSSAKPKLALNTAPHSTDFFATIPSSSQSNTRSAKEISVAQEINTEQLPKADTQGSVYRFEKS